MFHYVSLKTIAAIFLIAFLFEGNQELLAWPQSYDLNTHIIFKGYIACFKIAHSSGLTWSLLILNDLLPTHSVTVVCGSRSVMYFTTEEESISCLYSFKCPWKLSNKDSWAEQESELTSVNSLSQNKGEYRCCGNVILVF